MRAPLIVGVCVILQLVGCDTKPPEKTVFHPKVQTINKAREMEQKLQEGAQQRREQVEGEAANGER